MLGGMHGRRGFLKRIGVAPRPVLYLGRVVPVLVLAWLGIAFFL
jgi:hypothetical protein